VNWNDNAEGSNWHLTGRDILRIVPGDHSRGMHNRPVTRGA
jgi:hypothetical protein